MCRILLVEDHEATRLGLSDVLRGWEHEVHAADSLTQALQLISHTSFDLLISDIDLPDGTGWELARYLESDNRPPAIAMSGSSTEEDIRTSLNAGFKTHLAKPLRAKPLAQAIEEALG
jgi:CheY-like chemotaxis protein